MVATFFRDANPVSFDERLVHLVVAVGSSAKKPLTTIIHLPSNKLPKPIHDRNHTTKLCSSESIYVGVSFVQRQHTVIALETQHLKRATTGNLQTYNCPEYCSYLVKHTYKCKS